jgi:predicted 3-demethylubiquinone-9 3-methyltransferase (glyoxalase superfamily)
MEAVVKQITPHLWFTDKAEEAARFYCAIFPNSHVDRVTTSPADTPSGPAGSVVMVDFTLNGQQFMALSAGPLDPFNHAVSFVVNCESQEEVDRYWEALLKGGNPEQCGWLKDRYGVSWQVVPTVLKAMIDDADRQRAKRVIEAMLKMVKLDITELRRAYETASEANRMPGRWA